MNKYRKMTKEELDEILINHRHWLYRDVDGWEAMKATLCGIDLSNADLSGVDLSNAHFSGVDLTRANLCGANLSGAYLSNVKLSHVNLHDANLSNAYFSKAWMPQANLHNTNLSGAVLSYAILRKANLSNANLSGADLLNADISGVDLYCVDLSNAKNIPYVPMTCPEEGEFIGYKQACGKIVVLSIPATAKRSSATGRKCRCDMAEVLEIDEIGGTLSDVMEVRSDHDRNFIYRVGEIVSVDYFDEDRFKECAPGIHFFINRKEAENYHR